MKKVTDEKIDTECKKTDAMNYIANKKGFIDKVYAESKVDELTYSNNIVEILSILNNEERVIVDLHVIKRYSFEEIEDITGIKHSTAHYRYNKAINKLKVELRTEENWIYNFNAIIATKVKHNGYPFWDIAMRQKPCTLMNSIDGVVCPGVYNEKGPISLICSKSFMGFNYTGNITLDEYRKLNNISRKTAYKHILQGKIKFAKCSPGRYKKTSLINFKKCEQDVFDPSIHKFDNIKYYSTKIDLIKERMRGELDINRYHNYQKNLKDYSEQLEYYKKIEKNNLKNVG